MEGDDAAQGSGGSVEQRCLVFNGMKSALEKSHERLVAAREKVDAKVARTSPGKGNSSTSQLSASEGSGEPLHHH